MPVVVVHDPPGFTREQYDQVVEKLTGGAKSVMDSPSDWPVEGLLVHTAGDTGDGFRVVDVWESEEAVNAFAAHLEPILQEVGVGGPPQVYPAQVYVKA